MNFHVFRWNSPFRLSVATFLVTLALAGHVYAATTPGEKKQTEPGKCYAVLLAGKPGTKLHARRYGTWLKEFHTYLTGAAGFEPGNVFTLSGDSDFKEKFLTASASQKSIVETLGKCAALVRPQDQFILFIVGHGVISERPPTLVLPGKDIDTDELSSALEGIKARNQAILNFSASSGSSLTSLARKGRANISATSPGEGNEPVFAEFFLRGLISKRADGEGAPAAGSKDGRITLLEAFNWATHQTALWICRQRAVGQSGEWQISGKESVAIFKKLYSAPDGWVGTRKLAASSDGNTPDKSAIIKPKDGIIDLSWKGKRILSEHSLLEDLGEETGVSAIGKDGYVPIPGKKAGEPGSYSRRIVIGKPQLAPVK